MGIIYNPVITPLENIAAGTLHVSSSIETIISAINTPAKVLGTTIAENLDKFTSPTNNRLLYVGSDERIIESIASISFRTASNNQDISFYLALNGSVITATRQQSRIGTGADIRTMSLSYDFDIFKNDFIEVWVENNTGSSNITIEFMNLSVK